MFRRTIYNPCESFLDLTDHWSNQKSVVLTRLVPFNPFHEKLFPFSIPSTGHHLKILQIALIHFNFMQITSSADIKKCIIPRDDTGRDHMRSKYFNNLPLFGCVRNGPDTSVKVALRSGNLFTTSGDDICKKDSLRWNADKYHVRYFGNESKGSRELAKLNVPTSQLPKKYSRALCGAKYNMEIWYFSFSLFSFSLFCRLLKKVRCEMLRIKHTTQQNMTAIINSVCIQRFKQISGYSRTIPGTLLSAMFLVIIEREFEMFEKISIEILQKMEDCNDLQIIFGKFWFFLKSEFKIFKICQKT